MITPATTRVTPRAKTMTRQAVSSPRLRRSASRNARSRAATLGGALASILLEGGGRGLLDLLAQALVVARRPTGVPELPTLAGFGSSSDGFRDTTHMLVGGR